MIGSSRQERKGLTAKTDPVLLEPVAVLPVTFTAR